MADRMNPAFSTEVHWKHADNSVSHVRSGDGCMCEDGCMARQHLPLSFSTLLLKTRSLTEPSSLAGSSFRGPSVSSSLVTGTPSMSDTCLRGRWDSNLGSHICPGRSLPRDCHLSLSAPFVLSGTGTFWWCLWVPGGEGNALTTLTWDEGTFATGELFVINVCYVVLIIL